MSFFKTNAHWLVLSATAAISVAGSAYLFQDVEKFPSVLAGLFPRPIQKKDIPPVQLDALLNATTLVGKPGQWNTGHGNLLFVGNHWVDDKGVLKHLEDSAVYSKDGIAIPNKWFTNELPEAKKPHKGKLPVEAAGIADLDSDGDGFTNVEEFLAGTDPTDPEDHPPLILKLSFVKNTEIHNRISFLQYLGDVAKPPSLKITIRRDDAPKRPQHDLKIEDKIPGTEIKLLGFESRRKDDSGIKDALDGSVIHLIDGATNTKQVAEIKEKAADFVDRTIFLELDYLNTRREITTKTGQTFVLSPKPDSKEEQKETYEILDLTPNGVNVRDKNGKTIEIKRRKAE